MRSKADGFIRLILVTPFVQHAESQGVDPCSVFKTLGLDKDMIRDPNATVHAEIIYGLCNELATLAGDPFLGCHVGEQFDLANWPPFVAAGIKSRTVGEFLCSLPQHVPQESSSVRHALTIEADCATYSISRLIKTQNPPVQTEGFGIALYLRLLQSAGIDEWASHDVRVYTPFPDSVPRGYMGVRMIKSDGLKLDIKFPPAWLHAPLALNVSKLNKAGDTSSYDLSIVAALHSAARPLLADRDLGAGQIAAKLGLDANRMEAALRMQNTTAARELKRLRISVAKGELEESDQTVAEIGRSLGYTDQSHFTRFFRSQTGTSPSVFRKNLRGGA